jgi:hypothetical protein
LTTAEEPKKAKQKQQAEASKTIVDNPCSKKTTEFGHIKNINKHRKQNSLSSSSQQLATQSSQPTQTNASTKDQKRKQPWLRVLRRVVNRQTAHPNYKKYRYGLSFPERGYQNLDE